MTDLLLPTSFDVAWTVLTFGSVLLFAGALVVWSRARRDRGGAIIDLVVIVALPLIGPACYLLGRAWSARSAGGTSTP